MENKTVVAKEVMDTTYFFMISPDPADKDRFGVVLKLLVFSFNSTTKEYTIKPMSSSECYEHKPLRIVDGDVEWRYIISELTESKDFLIQKAEFIKSMSYIIGRVNLVINKGTEVSDISSKIISQAADISDMLNSAILDFTNRDTVVPT